MEDDREQRDKLILTGKFENNYEDSAFETNVIDGMTIEVNVTVRKVNVANRTMHLTTGLPLVPEIVPDIIRGMLVSTMNNLKDKDVVNNLKDLTTVKKVEL